MDVDAAGYRRDGFTIGRGLFPADRVAELAAEAERLHRRGDLIDVNTLRCRWQNHVETGECRFDCFDPVIDLSEPCERAARDPRLLAAIGAIYGERACLFKDKLIFKAPGTAGGLKPAATPIPPQPRPFLEVPWPEPSTPG